MGTQGNVFHKSVQNSSVATVYLIDPSDGTRLGSTIQLPNGSKILVDGNNLTVGPNNTEFVLTGSLVQIVSHASNSAISGKLAETAQPITVTDV